MEREKVLDMDNSAQKKSSRSANTKAASPQKPTKPSAHASKSSNDASPAQTAPASQSDAAATPKQPMSRRKKKLIIMSVLGAITTILIITAALLYFLWWQSPRKMVEDALFGALTSPQSSITINNSIAMSSQSNDAITLQGTLNRQGQQMELQVSATVRGLGVEKPPKLTLTGVVTENGQVYVKAKDIKEAINEYIRSDDRDLANLLPDKQQQVADVHRRMKEAGEKIVKELDNQWVQLTTSGNSANIVSCVMKGITKPSRDSAARQELSQFYQKHRFIQVKKSIEDRDGAKGFEIGFDGQAIRDDSFAHDLLELSMFKDIAKDCQADSRSMANALKFIVTQAAGDLASSENSGSMRLWVDPLSHQLRQSEAAHTIGGTKLKSHSAVDFNKKVTITAPKQAKSLDEALAVLKSLNIDVLMPVPAPQPGGISTEL